MSSRKLETCFISTPVGVDTKPLRDALAERGVQAWEISDRLTGSRVPPDIEVAIADADFLCAVIPAGRSASNVYFEIGLAVGIDRPSLLFVEPGADLPVALRELPYARAALSDAEALRFHLDAFLKNAGKAVEQRDLGRGEEPVRLDPVEVTFSLDQLAAWEAQNTPPREQDLVAFLADVFEAAGYVTSTTPVPIGQRGDRPDMAVWIDELQSTVGNPLLIEVVLKNSAASTKVRQLQQVLVDLQSPLGLVVFWQPNALSLPEDWSEPIVVMMSVRELVEAIGRGDFARTLLTRRNAFVHSAA